MPEPGRTRGDVCRVRRWDAEDSGNLSKSVAAETGYSTLGAVVFTRDALGHRTGVSYLDSDGGTRLAYPTTVTDPGGFTATARPAAPSSSARHLFRCSPPPAPSPREGERLSFWGLAPPDPHGDVE